jgi:hypothetical protein
MYHEGMGDETAASTLLWDLSELRRVVRQSAGSFWYPMVAFGLVGVGGGVANLGNGAVQIAWWVLALGGAATLTARFYRCRSTALGAVANHRRYWVLWLAITVAVFGSMSIVPVAARAEGPWILVALGYGLAGTMARSARLAVLTMMLGCAAGAAVALTASATVVDLACGLILVGSGLAARRAEHGP